MISVGMLMQAELTGEWSKGTTISGFVGESYIQFGGSDSFERAKCAAEVMQRRLKLRQIEPIEFRSAYIGVDSLFAPWFAS